MLDFKYLESSMRFQLSDNNVNHCIRIQNLQAIKLLNKNPINDIFYVKGLLMFNFD